MTASVVLFPRVENVIRDRALLGALERALAKKNGDSIALQASDVWKEANGLPLAYIAVVLSKLPPGAALNGWYYCGTKRNRRTKLYVFTNKPPEWAVAFATSLINFLARQKGNMTKARLRQIFVRKGARDWYAREARKRVKAMHYSLGNAPTKNGLPQLAKAVARSVGWSCTIRHTKKGTIYIVCRRLSVHKSVNKREGERR